MEHTSHPLGSRQPEAKFSQRVLRVVRRIPPGRVVSYGDIAAMLGAPRAARGVGMVLSTLDGNTSVPWWRVVNRNGAISLRAAHYGAALQRILLEAEGVRFDRSGRIDWRRWRWNPDGDPG